MRANKAMLLGSVGALAALMIGVPAQAQSTSARVAVWADRTGFDDYEWIDRADAISETIGEAPPDTSFAFEDATPWAWTLEDGTVLVVEEQGDGPHGYYFEAGSDEPFLVRDPEMSFGFVEGGLAVIYGADGGVMTRTEGRLWFETAMRGFERGKLLKRAMARRDRWRNVGVSAWVDFSYLLYDWQDQWYQGRQRHSGWRRHHQGPRGAEHRRRWEHERRRRQVLRDVFRRWGETGFRGRAPGRFTPPAPGTRPPRWGDRDGRPGGRGPRDGRGNWNGRPRTGTQDPLLPGVAQPDIGVAPVGQGQGPRGADGGGRGPGQRGDGRPPGPRGQNPVAETPPVRVPPPVAADPPPAPVIETPRPRPRPETRSGEPRVRTPRPAPDMSSDDTPPQPRYSAPTPRPVRVERPDFTPPPPRVQAPAPTYTPAPAPTRSYTPSPSPAPTRSYTPSPSPAPAPRNYTPSPSPTPSPAPAPSRSGGRSSETVREN